MSQIPNEQKKRISEIIETEGYDVVGMDKMDGTIFIGIVPKNYQQISKELSEKINEELGLETIINLWVWPCVYLHGAFLFYKNMIYFVY